MRRFPFAALATILLLAGAGELRAWGDDGHMMVGELAWRNLSPAAQREVADLLRGDDRTLAWAATWADRLRDDPAWDWVKPYHYINAPDGAESLDLGRDCPPQGCVVRGIAENLAVLADRGKPFTQRRESLKFLAHFVGDLHQPLHASYASDRGGNEVRLTFFGRDTNLHRVWDSDMIGRHLGWPRGWARRSWARRLDGAVSDEERAAWQAGTPFDWAAESFALARSNAYLAHPGDDLREAYVETNFPVIERRLQMGGLRLAWLIEQALSSP